MLDRHCLVLLSVLLLDVLSWLIYSSLPFLLHLFGHSGHNLIFFFSPSFIYLFSLIISYIPFINIPSLNPFFWSTILSVFVPSLLPFPIPSFLFSTLPYLPILIPSFHSASNPSPSSSFPTTPSFSIPSLH